ncbi:NADH:flavin oxidoreductase [Trichoderma camerunense]
MPSLLEPIRIGALNCPNRIIMSPMTRNGAPNAIPNKMMLDYYVRRASFGLVITEGITVSPMAVGYPRVSEIWTMEQTKAWREITTSVHEAGGRIIAQLWHVGRLSYPYHLNESKPIGPSAIAAPGDVINMMPTEPYPVPRALDIWEVPEICGIRRCGASWANGYILDQFLTDSTNSRVDEYGGTIENRAKLLLGAVDAVVSVWGADRVGIQLSPRPSPGWHGDSNPIGIFSYLMRELSPRQIAFVIVRESPNKQPYIGAHLRPLFSGTYISNEEFSPDTAKRAVLQGDTDAVAFGQLALANPDLPKRIADEAPLNHGDISTYWSAGSKGYDDYPTLDILYTTTST